MGFVACSYAEFVDQHPEQRVFKDCGVFSVARFAKDALTQRQYQQIRKKKLRGL